MSKPAHSDPHLCTRLAQRIVSGAQAIVRSVSVVPAVTGFTSPYTPIYLHEDLPRLPPQGIHNLALRVVSPVLRALQLPGRGPGLNHAPPGPHPGDHRRLRPQPVIGCLLDTTIFSPVIKWSPAGAWSPSPCYSRGTILPDRIRHQRLVLPNSSGRLSEAAPWAESSTV